MPALSKKQQRFFGIVRAIQKGEQAPTTPETAKAAADMKKTDVKKFASTKHKGLPEKKVTTEELKLNRKISFPEMQKRIRDAKERGRVDFRTGMSKGKQAMKSDKVTVMNKGTKASGGKKARKRPESPEGKAIGALMRHKTQQYSSERKASDARKAGDKKSAAKHDAAANRAYQRRRGVSGTLFDKTGNFHDRADND